MKKSIVICGMAAASVLAFAGCRMCTDPIEDNPACIESSHVTGSDVQPEAAFYTKPLFVPTKDVFRPSYRAGMTRISAVGTGDSLEDATASAMAKLLAEEKCDYVVAVTRIVTKMTHPAGFFRFPTTNYTVTVSGLPVYLDKLEKIEMKKPEPPKSPYPSEKDLILIIQNIVKNQIKIMIPPTPPTPPAPAPAPAPYAMVKLTDINLSMTAKAASNDPLAIAVPAPKPCPEKKK